MRDPCCTRKPGAKKYFNNRRYRVKKAIRLELLKGKYPNPRRKEENGKQRIFR